MCECVFSNLFTYFFFLQSFHLYICVCVFLANFSLNFFKHYFFNNQRLLQSNTTVYKDLMSLTLLKIFSPIHICVCVFLAIFSPNFKHYSFNNQRLLESNTTVYKDLISLTFLASEV